jgi:hypothetical protein
LFLDFVVDPALSYALAFPGSFRVGPLRQEPRFEPLPGIVIQLGNEVYGGLK